MHNLSTMKQIKTWFAPLNLKSALHVVLQIYVFWGDVNLSGHLRLCILMVFRPSRVRRILMQFYVWKNINGLFTFALSTPEDRLHDIIVFLYIWSSKFRLLIYRWKWNFRCNSDLFVTKLLYKILYRLLDFFKWMLSISKKGYLTQKQQM